MPKRKRSKEPMGPSALRYIRRQQALRRRRKPSLATKVKKLSQIVNKTFETKTKDILYDLAIGTGGSNQPVQFALTQGDGSDERVGNKVTLKSVTLDATYVRADNYNRMRMILLQPLDGNEPVGLADVLKYNVYATHGNLVFSSPYTTRTTTDRRYKILMDTTFEMNSFKNYAIKKGKITYSKGGKVIHYDGTSVNPTSYNLQLLHISDSVAAPYPSAKLNIRFKYIDA